MIFGLSVHCGNLGIAHEKLTKHPKDLEKNEHFVFNVTMCNNGDVKFTSSYMKNEVKIATLSFYKSKEDVKILINTLLENLSNLQTPAPGKNLTSHKQELPASYNTTIAPMK